MVFWENKRNGLPVINRKKPPIGGEPQCKKKGQETLEITHEYWKIYIETSQNVFLKNNRKNA